MQTRSRWTLAVVGIAVLIAASALLFLRGDGAKVAIAAQIQGLRAQDYNAVLQSAPNDEIEKNSFSIDRLSSLFRAFQQADSFSDLGDAHLTEVEPSDPSGENHQKRFRVTFSKFPSKELFVEAYRDTNGNWKVPVYHMLLNFAKVHAESPNEVLENLAQALAAAGIEEFYVWHRGSYLSTEKLALAGQGEIDPNSAESR